MTNPGITITAMTMDHVDDVLRLWERTDGVILMDTDNAEDLRDYFERNPGISQVALENGIIVGAVLCGHDGRRGYLHHLAVTESHRRRGLGRDLVAACIEKLSDLGIKACNLFVENEKRFRPQLLAIPRLEALAGNPCDVFENVWQGRQLMNLSDVPGTEVTGGESGLLDRILGHDAWAMGRFLTICEQLSDESLDADFDIGHRTIRKTLDHMIWNIERWTALMTDHIVPDRSSDTTYAGLQRRYRIAAKSFESTARAAVEAGRFSDEYEDPIDGLRKTIGSTILHVTTHNMHHRAHLVFMFRRLGVTDLPEDDVLTWEQQQKKEEQEI